MTNKKVTIGIGIFIFALSVFLFHSAKAVTVVTFYKGSIGGTATTTFTAGDQIYYELTGADAGADLFASGTVDAIATHEHLTMPATGNLATTTWGGGSFNNNTVGEYYLVNPTNASCATGSLETCRTANPGMGNIPDARIGMFTISPYVITGDINLTFPTATTTADFSVFRLSISTSTALLDFGSYAYVGVQYGLSTSTLNYDNYISWSPFVSSYSPTIPKSTALWFPPLATTTTWYFRPYLQYENGVVIGDITSSTISTVQQNNFNDNNWAYSTSSFATTTDFATTTLYPGYQPTDIPQFGAATSTCPDGLTICIVQFFFIPHNNPSAYLTSSFDKFKTVFPFKYFFAIVQTTKTIAENASSTPSLSLQLNLPNAFGTTGSTSTIPLLGPTTGEDTFGHTFMNWWFNLVLMLLMVGIMYGFIKLFL